MFDTLIEGGTEPDECGSFLLGIGAGVYRSRPTGEILQCNPGFARIFGFAAPDEVKAVPAASLYLAPGDREEWLATLRSLGAIPSGQLVMRRRDGSPVQVAYSERFRRDRSGAELIEGVLIELVRSRPSREAGAPRWRILVVDDDARLARALQRVLSAHEVVSASSVAEALRALAADARFDAVVSDVMMPEATGLDLFRAVAGRWPDLAARMIFMSGGIADAAVAREVAALGAPILEKPFHREQLLALVAAAAARGR